MKQIIPFSKEIVFKTNIASITSISLEHEERVSGNEINGDFNIYGEYKERNDTTEILDFKYHLPFTTIIPDNLESDTIKIDVEDFTYDTVEPDVIKVNIDISIEGEEKTPRQEINLLDESPYDIESLKTENIFNESEKDPERKNDKVITSDIEIDKINYEDNSNKIDANINLNSDNFIVNDIKEVNNVKEEPPKEETTQPITVNNNNEYITYHIHIVNEHETIEDIIKKYDTTLDNIKAYNNITNLNYGDKLIIPDSNE